MSGDYDIKHIKELHELILQQLNDISSRLKLVEQTLEHIKNDNEAMTRHIGFVESIYHAIRSPLEYVLSGFRQTSSFTLPENKDKYITEN